ncbi:hypothetical protein ACOXXX_03255 [Thalassococcus sp. BH17M4-6]|uniref:hypothetical protein n=1 Tax=Thalassococcus sp. BH17M4-6 TaxID=3413148 RepID=UPI003BC56217
MDLFFIVPVLALITMFAVIVFAIKSKYDVEAKRDDPNADKSALAADGPAKG